MLEEQVETERRKLATQTRKFEFASVDRVPLWQRSFRSSRRNKEFSDRLAFYRAIRTAILVWERIEEWLPVVRERSKARASGVRRFMPADLFGSIVYGPGSSLSRTLGSFFAI